MDTTERHRLICSAKLCPYCEGAPVLTSSKIIYGERSSYGNIWLCVCGAYCGCHKGTDKPLGRVADAELREWKKKAHTAFDSLWRDENGIKKGVRDESYHWLCQELGIDRSHTHIGMFDVDQCQRVVELVSQRADRASAQSFDLW